MLRWICRDSAGREQILMMGRGQVLSYGCSAGTGIENWSWQICQLLLTMNRVGSVMVGWGKAGRAVLCPPSSTGRGINVALPSRRAEDCPPYQPSEAGSAGAEVCRCSRRAVLRADSNRMAHGSRQGIMLFSEGSSGGSCAAPPTVQRRCFRQKSL